MATTRIQSQVTWPVQFTSYFRTVLEGHRKIPSVLDVCLSICVGCEVLSIFSDVMLYCPLKVVRLLEEHVAFIFRVQEQTAEESNMTQLASRGLSYRPSSLVKYDVWTSYQLTFHLINI
jgi:hypothetical protein